MSLTYQQLMDELTRLVTSHSSGTLFIHSDCNHLITFTLKSGRITALYFGPRKGQKAIQFILGISGGSCRFETTGLTREPQQLPPTQEIISMLRSGAVGHNTKITTVKSGLDSNTWTDEKQRGVLEELKVILTDYLGPIAGIIVEESLDELSGSALTDDSYQELIDKLSLNIDPDEVREFQHKAKAMLNGNPKG